MKQDLKRLEKTSQMVLLEAQQANQKRDRLSPRERLALLFDQGQ